MVQERFIVIDVQGFYIANKLTAKEVSISDINQTIKTFLIKPPFKYSNLTVKERNTNKWLYYHLHGLSWNDGNCILKEVNEYLKLLMIKEDYPIIYVKGLEKLKWLKELVGEDYIVNVINLDDFNCPNIKMMYKHNININICNSHRKNYNYMCAEKSVILLRNFINSYLM